MAVWIQAQRNRDYAWMNAPLLDPAFDASLDLDPASAPGPVSTVEAPAGAPCGLHSHERGTIRGWCAAAWLCVIAQHLGQDVKAVTAHLRVSPKYNDIRATLKPGEAIVNHPVWLPWLAMPAPGSSRLRIELLRDGADFATLLNAGDRA